MIKIRKSGERGSADHGWLKSLHTFSFAGYHDPEFMGFRSLRVINEDRIQGGTGFGKHPHRDMEIISYVIKGALSHEDSMGSEAVIQPGDVQRMSAGTGVAHSEFNANADEEAHFLQIWIMPKTSGGAPGYGQKSFAAELKENRLVLVVSEDARDGSIGIKQDADIYIARIQAESTLSFQMRPGRGVWIQMVGGRISINGKEVSAGDAASTELAGALELRALESSEFILFDLA